MNELQTLIIKQSKTKRGAVSSDSVFAAYTASQVGNTAGKMVPRGQVFRAKISHKVVIYFDTAKRAREAEAAAALKNAEPAVKIGAAKQTTQAWRDQVAHRPPGLKVMVIPTPPPRFCAIEVKGIHGALQRGRVS